MAIIEYQWKRYLKYIFEQGHTHTKDDSEIQEVLGYHAQILSPINFLWVCGEKGEELLLNAIRGGTYNIPNYPIKDEALYKYVTAWDQDDMINCDNFVYTYPERLFNYPINQYEIIKNRLLDLEKDKEQLKKINEEKNQLFPSKVLQLREKNNFWL